MLIQNSLLCSSKLMKFRSTNLSRSMTMSADILTDSSLVTSAINAWSVNGAALNSADTASSFFAVSLFPYLAMLYFLNKSETKTPKTAYFGFCFLLAFVFATIPAGIYAKYQYHDILANVDWLHGTAESLLTVTNILIISGFRKTRTYEPTTTTESENSFILKDNGVLIAGILAIISLIGINLNLSSHIEPSNALSLPTWVVHSSSVLEWLIAMKMIWEHSYTSNNPRWKGMTVAMMPSHASGICACAFHLFYNNPVLTWMVVLQSALTAIGNTCMAIAAYRIFQYENDKTKTITNESVTLNTLDITQPLSLSESNIDFGIQLILKSILVAISVKYGELFFNFPFDAQSQAALIAILLPVLYNIGLYTTRATSSTDNTVNKQFI